jgi:hypothetical protein
MNAVCGERERIVQAQKGDRVAFGKLVELYQQPVFTLTYRMLGNAQDAEDRAQEAFLKAYQGFRSCDAQSVERFGRPCRTGFSGLLGLLRSIVAAVVMSLLMAGLGALAVALLPRQTQRVMLCLESAWPTSLGVGLLSAIAALGIATMLIVTLCLAPIGLLLLLATSIAWLMGWVSVGAIVGEKLFLRLSTTEASPVVPAMTGTGLLTLLSHTPCLGWLLGLAAGTVGLGAVVLTRFGTRTYTGSSVTPASPLPTPPPGPTPES